MSDPIIVEETYNVTVERVWNAITSDSEMKQWYFEEMESFKPETGFMTQFNVKASRNDYLHIWKVTEVIPFKKIVYRWTYKGYYGESFSIWELTPEGSGTRLKLTCVGLESFPQDNPDFTRESCTGGWKYFLCERLKKYLDRE